MGWFYMFAVLEHVHFAAYVTGFVAFAAAVIAAAADPARPDASVANVIGYERDDRQRFIDAAVAEANARNAARMTFRNRMIVVVMLCGFVASVTPTLETMLRQRADLSALQKDMPR